MNHSRACSFALLAATVLAWPLPALATGDCANGKTLYTKTGSLGLSCSNSSCHKPAVDGNNIRLASGNPGLIDQRLNTQAEMAGLRADLGLTASDIDDLATWIFYAPSCPAPTPNLQASPVPVTFGSTAVGAISSAAAVTITNSGTASATGVTFTNSNAAEFAVSGNNCSTTIAAGASCSLNVAFKPATAGARSGTLSVSRTGGAGVVIGISGTGAAAATPGQLSPSSALGFGSQTVGTTSIASVVGVTNTGGAAVTVSSVASSNASEFTVASSNCTSVNPGQSCTIGVTFSPAAVGARAATIIVTSNGVGSPQGISVSGTGVAVSQPTTVDLVEYHHSAWDHYFVTGIADEITKLDNGTFVGWARTGYKLKAYPTGTAGSNAVCRFFSTAFAPKSSHFYTPFASECTTVKGNADWQFEAEVFNNPIPAQDGTCSAGTVPVYRLYNNGQGAAPNHRYTTSLAIRAQMIAQGWVPEGYGAIGVIMCSPQ
jgi:hypothetical protein